MQTPPLLHLIKAHRYKLLLDAEKRDKIAELKIKVLREMHTMAIRQLKCFAAREGILDLGQAPIYFGPYSKLVSTASTKMDQVTAKLYSSIVKANRTRVAVEVAHDAYLEASFTGLVQKILA